MSKDPEEGTLRGIRDMGEAREASLKRRRGYCDGIGKLAKDWLETQRSKDSWLGM